MAVSIEDRLCKGCGVCVATCPKEILKISDRRNAKGMNIVENIDQEKCIACGMCQDICPDLAIWVCETETV